MPYTIGLDYGTNSVRCLIVDVTNGNELGTAVYEYETGEVGIILDPADHNLARQNPADYIKGIEVTVKAAIAEAKNAVKDFDPKQIIGIGIDTTGSTPIPVDKNGTPLGMLDAFKDNPNAHAWLWKDHTGHAEAAEITALAEKEHPEYLAKCGGIYSSEWFFSKILHCEPIRRFSTPPTHGPNMPTGCLRYLQELRRRTNSNAADVPPAIRPCSTMTGAATPKKNFSQSSIRNSANSEKH